MKLYRTKKKAIKKSATLLIAIILFLVLSISLYSIYEWRKDSNVLEQEIAEITKSVNIDQDEETDSTSINPPFDQKSPYWDYIKTKLIDVDLTALKALNPETKGWIQVTGTNINYPFVQANDNAYYLNHSYFRQVNGAGWVFIDSRNDIDKLDQNTIIYAHGRIDSILFSTLKNILSSDWYTNRDNHTIKVSTTTHNSLWQIFSIYHIQTTSDYLAINQQSKESNLNFLNYLKERSAVPFEVELFPDDKILTLSTCYSSTEKVVMHAKLIKKNDRD